MCFCLPVRKKSFFEAVLISFEIYWLEVLASLRQRCLLWLQVWSDREIKNYKYLQYVTLHQDQIPKVSEHITRDDWDDTKWQKQPVSKPTNGDGTCFTLIFFIARICPITARALAKNAELAPLSLIFVYSKSSWPWKLNKQYVFSNLPRVKLYFNKYSVLTHIKLYQHSTTTFWISWSFPGLKQPKPLTSLESMDCNGDVTKNYCKSIPVWGFQCFVFGYVWYVSVWYVPPWYAKHSYQFIQFTFVSALIFLLHPCIYQEAASFIIFCPGFVDQICPNFPNIGYQNPSARPGRPLTELKRLLQRFFLPWKVAFIVFSGGSWGLQPQNTHYIVPL